MEDKFLSGSENVMSTSIYWPHNGNVPQKALNNTVAEGDCFGQNLEGIMRSGSPIPR